MSDAEREHYDALDRALANATAATDRHIIAEYQRAVDRGENPPPPLLCEARRALEERETAARRASAPPYTGSPRQFAPAQAMYGFPDDVRDDEIELFNAEQRRPWTFPRGGS